MAQQKHPKPRVFTSTKTSAPVGALTFSCELSCSFNVDHERKKKIVIRIGEVMKVQRKPERVSQKEILALDEKLVLDLRSTAAECFRSGWFVIRTNRRLAD